MWQDSKIIFSCVAVSQSENSDTFCFLFFCSFTFVGAEFVNLPDITKSAHHAAWSWNNVWSCKPVRSPQCFTALVLTPWQEAASKTWVGVFIVSFACKIYDEAACSNWVCELGPTVPWKGDNILIYNEDTRKGSIMYARVITHLNSNTLCCCKMCFGRIFRRGLHKESRPWSWCCLLSGCNALSYACRMEMVSWLDYIQNRVWKQA